MPSETPTAPLADRRSWRTVVWRIRRDPLTLAGVILVALAVASAVFADLLVAYGPNKINPRDMLQGPGMSHWLGTDQLGRDTFSRIVYGGRVALGVAVTAIGISLAAGVSIGIVAAFSPRWLDSLLLLVLDAIRSFPTVLFALALVTLIGPSLTTVLIVVVSISIPSYARVARTQALSIKSSDYVLAARSMGFGRFRILATDVAPNLIGPLLILASMEIPLVITIEAGLSFLGFGIQPPTPSWGSVLNDGFNYVRDTPWLIVAGGIPLVVTTLGFTFLGEGLRDIFDPRLEQGR